MVGLYRLAREGQAWNHCNCCEFFSFQDGGVGELEVHHEVAEGTVDEAYKNVADAFGYEILGKASDEDIDAFRAEPGTLRDRFWEKYAFQT